MSASTYIKPMKILIIISFFSAHTAYVVEHVLEYKKPQININD